MGNNQLESWVVVTGQGSSSGGNFSQDRGMDKSSAGLLQANPSLSPIPVSPKAPQTLTSLWYF